MTTRGGTLSIGEHDLLKGTETRLAIDVPEYDVRVPQGIEVFRKIDLQADLKGEVIGLAPISTTYLAGSGITLDKGQGNVALFANVERGVVKPDARFDYATDELVVRTPTLSFAGAAEIAGTANDGLATEAKIPRATMAVRGDDAVTIEGARVGIGLDGADLSAEPRPKRGSLAVSAARASDVARLQPVFPKPLALRSGAAALAVRADYDDGALEGRVDVALEKVRVTSGKIDVTTSGKTWVSVISKDARRAISLAGSGVELRDTTVRVGNESQSGFAVRAEASDAVVTIGDATAIDAGIALHAGPGDRMLRLVAGIASLPKDLAEAPAGPEATAAVRLRKSGATASARVLEARNGDLMTRGFWKDRGPTSTGRFFFELGPIHTGVEIENGDVTVKPIVPKDWLEKQSDPR
jgi:hypothetical protein